MLRPGWNAALTMLARHHEYARGKCPDGFFEWQRGVEYFGANPPYPDIEFLSRVTLPGNRRLLNAESVTCLICGKSLTGKRRHSLTCSPKCRKALSRRRN